MTPKMCRLCSREGQLRESHRIPKFAANWIKRTSATGYLRGFVDPNLRVQDIGKVELLCEQCEQLLSRDERAFADRIFYPYVNREVHHFSYGEWLRRFAISLAWRGVVTGPALPATHPRHFHDALGEAACQWRHYLLGESKSPGPYTHHMFFAGYVRHTTADVPRGFQTYLMRAVDSTVAGSSTALLVYTKLPAIVFVSHVVPTEPHGWRRTRIRRKGDIGGGQVLDGPSGRFLLDRATEVLARWKLSSQQQVKVSNDLLKDPERSLRSKSFEAFLAEEHLRRVPLEPLAEIDWD